MCHSRYRIPPPPNTDPPAPPRPATHSFNMQGAPPLLQRAARRWPAAGRRRSLRSHRRQLSGSGEAAAGTVEGVFVFHRHGDRSPAKRLVGDSYADAEEEYWRSRVPPGPSLHDALSALYPAEIHLSNNAGKFFDTRREPYGFLTWAGMEQMRLSGRRCAQRYMHHGHSEGAAGGGGGAVATATASPGSDFLRHWNVQAYSTCYLRTVKSVQCFLQGLLADGDEKSFEDYQMHSLRDPDELEAAIAATVRGRRPASSVDADRVTVHVRDRRNDTLNAFDRNPDLMRDLVGEVVATPNFQRQDAAAAPLATMLCRRLPGLRHEDRRFFGGPSGINWIHAADHFVCRGAHGLPYLRFSGLEDDPREEEQLRGLRSGTLAHLAWRFRQWYRNPRLLAAIAAPPLREVEAKIRDAAAPGVGASGGRRRPFVVYSCHDVTILSLLYGLRADFLEDDRGAGARFWPEYGTSLTLELVRLREEGAEADVDAADPADCSAHALRIVLNGRPVRSVRLSDSPAQGDAMRISDFSSIIDGLEEAGGWGGEGRLADDPACGQVKRDMSGWTG